MVRWVFGSILHGGPIELSTGGFGFNQIVRHELQFGVVRSSLGINCLQVDLVLIRLSDMSFSSVFSDPHCRYSLSTGGFCFNKIVRHELQFGVLRSSLYVFTVYRWIWF